MQNQDKTMQKYNPITDPAYNGCLENPPDERDLTFGKKDDDIELKADPNAPSWEQGFSVEKHHKVILSRNHQGSSLSCVEQAWSKYDEMLNFIETGKLVRLSPKDGYSQIYLPGGAAYIRDGAKLSVNKGLCREELIPSMARDNPPSEAFMREKKQTDETRKDALIYRGKKFVELPVGYWKLTDQDWENLRQLLWKFKGFVAGYSGHCQYFIEYGLSNGKKYLKTVGSYGEGSDQLFKGEYRLFNVTAKVDLPNPPDKISMLKSVKKKNGSEIYLIGSDGFKRHITTMQTYNDLLLAGVIIPFAEEDVEKYPDGRDILHFLHEI